MPMVCPNCGVENPPGSRFCGSCGSALSQTCPACGAANDPSMRFCTQCGTALSGDVPAPAVAAPSVRVEPVAERRLVSVLFLDLAGFTTLSEARDPEEVRELLSRYFDEARTLIDRYGGTVEKFIGDAVMAVWGTPTAQEDDAERAVRAALDLVDGVPELDERLRARAGVLTGEAAVTVGAEGQGMVAGDLVNTASRVQSFAAPGAVLVGEATKRATEAAIIYEDAGEHELKGKSEALRLWRARRVVAARGGALRSTRLEPPFVGRERELRLVKDLFHATAEEGKARLVSLVGIAGIGKSRLSWEFEKYIDGLVDLVYWHRGRCLSYGEGVTYWALAEMVRMRAGIVEGEHDMAKEKLRAAVEEHVSDPDERSWIEPRLANLVGLDEQAVGDREDLFAAWRLFFERMAEREPTVLVFEDMQWADTSLLEFVEHLLEWSRSHPLYVITLARPELMERHPSWGAGKRNFTALSLESLSEAAMEELLDGFVPGLPGELRTEILARAEGVPLYAVETVRMLLDRGLLEQAGGEYRPTGPIEALAVPETLHALVAARIDGLTAEERRLLQDASVLGKSFTRQALADLSRTSDEELEPALAALVRKEVFSLQADPRSPERGQYAFVQDLLRRVAYETLAKAERKSRHLAAAAYLEERWGPAEQEIAEVVSSHYVEAYLAAPDADEAPEIRGKARATLTRAGERAESLAAMEEAQRYFERAAELADGPLDQAELHERAGRTAWKAGNAASARIHFERAVELFDSAGLTHPAARVTTRLAEITWQEGRIEEALEAMERAYVVLSDEEHDADFATVAAELGRLRNFAGRHGEAAEPIELALGIAESLRLAEVFASALITKGILLSTVGRVEEALALIRHALMVALDNDLPRVALRAYINLAAFMYEQDRHAEELEFADAGLELARRTGHHWQELAFQAGRATCLFWLGRWDEAVDEFDALLDAEDASSVVGPLLELVAAAPFFVERGDMERARQLVDLGAPGAESGDIQSRVVYLIALARLRRAEGRLEEALDAAQQAVALRPEMGLPRVKEALVEALEAALYLRDIGEAEKLLGVVEALPPGELLPFLRANGARFSARVASLQGHTERVEPGFAAAAASFDELTMPFSVGVTRLEHGEWLVEQGRRAEAEPLLAEAREIFERIGAAPWLERLRRSEAGEPQTAVA